jgi:hypothetical protein
VTDPSTTTSHWPYKPSNATPSWTHLSNTSLEPQPSLSSGSSQLGQITAVNTVPGPINDGDSYRCELSGIYGILVLCDLICCQHHGITQGAVHVRCDNKSSLLVFNPWFIPDPGKSSFNLTNSIWHLIKASPLRWTSEHVFFAHQEKTGLQLDRFASLNCDMDTLPS